MEPVYDATFDATATLTFKAEARYENCRFEGIDFNQHDLSYVRFVECAFSNCKFSNQKLMNTRMRQVAFKGCNLMGINWCLADKVEDLAFTGCKLDLGVFQELDLKGVQIKECSAIEVDFSEADLSGADLSGTDFTGATFANTRVAGADLRQSRGYVFDLRTTSIAKTKFSLPEVAGLIQALGGVLE